MVCSLKILVVDNLDWIADFVQHMCISSNSVCYSKLMMSFSVVGKSFECEGINSNLHGLLPFL